MSKTILLVEDSTDSRQMMRFLLQGSGYEVIEATDGIEAVDQAIDGHPDLILMDIAMPIADGIEAVEIIRQHENLDHIPIIAVTAYGDLYKDKALAAGCSDVIQKPLDLEEFESVIKRYIGSDPAYKAESN
jgi:two-component system cell cycle response regulator DivK